jgi:hypothetical protein
VFAFFRNLFRSLPPPPRPRSVRPQVEGLEDRAVLSTLAAHVPVPRAHHPNRLEARRVRVRIRVIRPARFNNGRFFNSSPFFGNSFFPRRSGFGFGLGLGFGNGFFGFSSGDPFFDPFFAPPVFVDPGFLAPVDPFFGPSFDPGFGGFF